MRRKILAGLFGLAMVIAIAQPSSAVTIRVFNQTATGGNDSGNDMDAFLQADDFIIPLSVINAPGCATCGTGNTAVRLTSATFWSLDAVTRDASGNIITTPGGAAVTPGFTGTVEWSIRTDAGGPGAIVASGVTAPSRVDGNSTLINPFGTGIDYELYVNQFGLPNVVAQASTSYWLVLHNGPSGNPTNNVFCVPGALIPGCALAMLWDTTPAGDSNPPPGALGASSEGACDALICGGLGPFGPNGNNFAFNLRGIPFSQVPEPGSLALLGLGASFLSFAGLRRRK